MPTTPPQMPPLSQHDALKQLVKGVQIACSRGAYRLEEAAALHRAVECFVDAAPDPSPGVDPDA